MLVKAEKIAESPGAKWNGVLLNGSALTVGVGSVEYVAYCDSATDDPYGFCASPMLPQLGDYYRSSLVRYVGFSAQYDGRGDGFYRWRTRYELGGVPSSGASSDSDDESTGESETTLLSIDASPEAETYAVPFDLDGTPNVNSVGEWFDDPLNVEFGRLRLTFKRRESANPWPLALEYWGAINAGPTWGRPPATLKVESIAPSLELTTGGTRWNVVYAIAYRALGWLVKRADAGFYATGANGVRRILNEDGSPKETPTLLNGVGGVLASGAAPVYRTFRVNPSKDFAALGLPNPFTL